MKKESPMFLYVCAPGTCPQWEKQEKKVIIKPFVRKGRFKAH